MKCEITLSENWQEHLFIIGFAIMCFLLLRARANWCKREVKGLEEIMKTKHLTSYNQFMKTRYPNARSRTQKYLKEGGVF